MAAEIFNASSIQHELPQISPSSTSQLQSAVKGFLAGWSTWQYVVTFLLGVVVYDQGDQKPRFHKIFRPADSPPSHVYQAKGFDRRTAIQNPTHGPVHPSTASEIRSVPCAVGEWTS